MRIHVKSLMATLCIGGLIATSVHAEQTSVASSTNTSAQIPSSSNDMKQFEKLAAQTKMLLAQVDDLQREVKHLKLAQNSTTYTLDTAVTEARVHDLNKTRAKARAKLHQVMTKPAETSSTEPTATTAMTSDADAKRKAADRRELARLLREEKEYLPFDIDVPGQAFVSTGPYVGVPLQYAGSDLIINSPSVNTDLQLLGIRKAISEQLQAMGGELKEPYHSHLLLSGVIEGQANYTDREGRQTSPDMFRQNSSYIDVTNVSLDAMILGPSDWILGFIEFSYDSSRPRDNFYTVSNSRVYVNKAFVTIGNLLKSPLYGTFGQMYVPFGRYSSVMISDPLTKIIGRTKARAVLLGFQLPGPNALYGSGYVFRGDSNVTGVSRINNGGVNIGYKYKWGFFHGDFGGGVIGNIADSAGFQLGTGFAQSAPAERLEHRVPGYNLRGIFSFGEHIDIITEWVTAASSFNVNDMSYNGHGAKPSAFDIEGAYSFYMFKWPSAVGLGYTHSYQALAMDIPMSRIYLVLNTSILRNTLQSIELRHDTNYGAHNTANGPVDAQAFPGQCVSATCRGSHESDNAITAQFDYYF